MRLIATPSSADYQPAYVSNGVVGARVAPIALLSDAATINGFVGVHPVEGVERWAYAPYPVAGDLKIGDTWLSEQPARAQMIDQTYDFATGEVLTRFRFAVDGAAAQVEVLTFASRSLPTLIVQEIALQIDRPADVVLRAGIRTCGAEGEIVARTDGHFSNKRIVDGSLLWQGPGTGSRAGLAFVTEWQGGDARIARAGSDAVPLAIDHAFRAEPGRRYVLRQIASSVPSLSHPEPDRQAIRMANLGLQRGFDALRAENRAAWAELWRGRPVLHGAGQRWQAIADAAFFYLNSSIHPSSPNSTGLLGCAMWRNYHNFNGHIFWDIETFSFPPLLLTQPPAARAILEFRHRTLPAARANAAMNGYRGAQYPWEASTSGAEVTPSGWPKIIHEQHITANVANAFALYVDATGDELFARDRAWPVLAAAAEWIESRIVKTARGYEIRCVTGIDEGRDRVNNNAWTNAGAIAALRNAAAVARRLGYMPPPAWERVAREMYLPVDKPSRTLMNYDELRIERGMVICPDALFTIFPLGHELPAEVERATLANWLAWSRPAVGWPMHSCFQGVWAARTGDRALSLELFERGVADYVYGPFMLFDEFGRAKTEGIKEKVGPYLAHCGGFLQGLLLGLPGLQMTAAAPEAWPRRPVVLPEGWDAIEVQRLWIRNEPAHLLARHGDASARL